MNNVLTFADKVVIVPKLLQREPIVQWEIVVENEKGDMIISETGEGGLPQFFTWQGQGLAGYRAADGDYSIVVKTWDRAGNMSLATERVRLAKDKPVVMIEASHNEHGICIDLKAEHKVPLSYWRFELRARNGALLHEIEGETLPLQLEMSHEQLSEAGKVDCLLLARDALGNTVRRKIDDIQQFAAKKIHQEQEQAGTDSVTEEWVEEF